MNNNIKTALLSALLIFSTFLNAQEWAEIEKKLPIPVIDNSEQKAGFSVDIQGDYAVIGVIGYENDKGIAYVYHYNGTEWEYQASLTASDGSNGDNFGEVDFDGDVIVVSAYGYNGLQGKVYVFEKPLQGWVDMTETTSFSAPNGVDGFSFAAISGDIIVIGSYGYTNNNYTGLVFVYEKNGTTWNTNPIATLEASDAAEYNFFCLPAIDDSVIVIGAPYNGAGVAYVFEKTGNYWPSTETARLTSTEAVAGDMFADYVAIKGNNIAISCSGINSATGKVYIFEKTGANWTDMTESSVLTASNGVADDRFGLIDMSGDNIVIGTQYANNLTGSAYIFTKTGTTWSTSTETAIITASDGEDDDKFGSVAIFDDKVIIGAMLDSVNDANSGSAYSFIKPQSGWTTSTETQKIISPEYYTAAGYSMGASTAMYGNYAVVGVHGWNGYQGKAIVYKYDGLEWNYQTSLIASDGDSSDYFGAKVAIYDDIIIVGAPQKGEGAVYIYQIPSTTWTDSTEIAVLSSDDYNTSNYLGNNIDIFEDIIVVSTNGYGDNGAVLVYKKPLTGWVNTMQTATLTYSDNMVYLGYSEVDIDSNYIAVGCPEYGGSSLDEGAVIVFNKQVNWVDATEDYFITTPGGGIDFGMFGQGISLLGDLLAVSDQVNNRVLMFENQSSNWTEIAELTNTDANTSELGRTMQLKEDYILVSSYNANSYTGTCYLYNKPVSGIWADNTETLILSASDGENNDGFSSGIASYGEYIFIGAYGNDDYGSFTGSTYIFKHCYSVNITDVPNDIAACENGNGSTFVEAEGPALTYQWQSFNGSIWSDIVGQTDSTLSVSDVTMSMDGAEYHCVVTGVCYTDTSEITHLTVVPKPANFTIIGQNTVDEFETVSYSTPFNTDLTYYWDVTAGNITSMPSNNNSNIQWGTTAMGYIYVVAEDLNTCKSDTMSLEVNIGGFVNINSINSENISIYPNPANNYINIVGESNNNYKIIDITGKTVLTSTNNKIDISKIEDGIYYLKLEDNTVRKFVVKH